MVSLQTLQQLDLNVILGKTEGYVAQDLENLVSRAIHSHTIQQGKELNFFIVPSYQCKSIRQQLHVAVLMKFKMLSLLFHVGMNVGSTAEKITSQDICYYNLPLSTVCICICLIIDLCIIHRSSRYLYLFGGNTWSLKTFHLTTLLATNDLWHVPLCILNSYILQSLLALYIFRDVFGVMKKDIHVSDSLEFFFFFLRESGKHAFFIIEIWSFPVMVYGLSLPWILDPFLFFSSS